MSDDATPRGPRRPPNRGGATPSSPRRPTPRPRPATPSSGAAPSPRKKPSTGKATPKRSATAKQAPPKKAARTASSAKPGGASVAEKRTSTRTPTAKRPIPDAPGPRNEPKAKPRTKAPATARGPASARLGTTKTPATKTAATKTAATKASAKAATKASARSATPDATGRSARAGSAFDSGTVARIRSERSPRTGWESITGSTKAVVIDAGEQLPPPATPATAFRQRYGVVYNTQGPRIRLGIMWLLAVALSLAAAPLRPYGLAVLYAVVAGMAAQQVVDAWHHERIGKLRWVTALGASSLPVLATLGTRPLGVGLLLLVVASIVVAVVDRRTSPGMKALAEAGNAVLAAGVCGGAAAALVLLANYDIGAVIILIVYLMVYDASDYIVGSGASNGVEGPLAGGLFIAATTMLLAVTEVPPFRGADVWNFAILAAVACPAGQLLASAMLPRSDAFAPALRRLDSLLIVAPAWAGLIGLYLQQAS